jgi:hypothetical protein
MSFTKIILLAVVTAGLIVSCNKKADDGTDTSDDSDSLYSISEQAFSEASSHASSSEGGSVGTNMISDEIELMSSELQELNNDPNNYINPQDRLTQAATACSYATARTCSGTTGTIAWNNCTIGTIATMTGGWTETWSNTADCANSYLSLNGVSPEYVERSSTASTITFPLGKKVVTDTNGGTAYDNTTVFVSGKVKTTRTFATTRSIAMSPTNSAVHKVMTSRRGVTLFDYFVQPNITVTGSLKNSTANGITGSRTMTGTVTIYHNLAKYTATNTFSAVTWGSSSCCYPTSGTISSTYTGTNKPADSGVMTFSTTCGTASFASTKDGTTTTTSVTLENCQ